MPKLWNETIEAHRAQVQDAILDTGAALVFEHGLRAVTMSQIAEQAGIGRATLYKYFPDVETILRTWHARQIGGHIAELTRVCDGAGTPAQRLGRVLTAYAHIAQQTGGHDRELVSFLHPDEQIVHARNHLQGLIAGLIGDGAEIGEIRSDIAPAELANYCLHSLAGAAALTEAAALTRLVSLTETALRPQLP